MTPSRPSPHAAVPGDPDPEGGAAEGVIPEGGTAAGRARNTIIFSVATGLSRIAGLIREVFSNALYGATGAPSAFTIAFAVPNLLRALFADMALSAAFVPVFSELLEQKRRREALLLLSTLFWVLLGGLTILVSVAMLTAPLYMPLFVGDEVQEAVKGTSADALTVGLSQVMLPTVLLLGLNGLFVGALNAYDHFTIPALSPLVWNFVIIVVNLALLPVFGGTDSAEGIYAQAVGVLVGTVAQLAMAVPVLRRYGIRLVPRVDLHDPRLRQVLILMVPVAISLGLINFSALIDSILASHVSDDGPRAIEAAFRLYMLPQGVFSVAIVTVLFPVLSRAVARGDQAELRGLVGSGMGQILVLLVPLGLLFASPVISHDIIETLFQRGEWNDANTDTATTALVFLGISLALNGVSLLLSRTFFALQRPWANTGLAMGSLVANVAVSVALYRPLGIAGIVIGTFVGNVVLVALQIRLLRKETGGPLGLLPVLRSLLQVLVASVLAVLTATGVVLIGDIGTNALGDGTASSLLTVIYLGGALVAGIVVYVGLAHELGLHELEQAGGRFVRLGARLRGLLLRLPGARGLTEVSSRPAIRRAGDTTDRALSAIALPLRPLTALAVGVSHALVALVPAGPVVAVGGDGPSPGPGPGDGPGGAAGGPGPGAGPTGGDPSGPPRGRGPRSGGPGGGGTRRDDRGAGTAAEDGGAVAPTEIRGAETRADVRSGATRRDPRGAGAEGGADASSRADAEDAVPEAEGPTTAPRPPRGRGAGRLPRPSAVPATPDAGAPGPAPTDADAPSFPQATPPREDVTPREATSQRGEATAPSEQPTPPHPAAPADEAPRSRGFGAGRRRRPAPPVPDPPTEDDGPALYDAVEDWPTIGQRGGETLDVPWPGIERGPDEDAFDEPSWDDEVGRSRLEAYGIDRAEGGLSPEQRARIEDRDRARRLIEAREEALARMAERQRRRREAEEKRGRRGRKGR